MYKNGFTDLWDSFVCLIYKSKSKCFVYVPRYVLCTRKWYNFTKLEIENLFILKLNPNEIHCILFSTQEESHEN